MMTGRNHRRSPSAGERWYRLDLGDAMLADTTLAQIRRRVLSEHLDASRPAAYIRHVSGALHCRVELLFAPHARDVAKALGAHPCAAPPQTGLEPLVGG